MAAARAVLPRRPELEPAGEHFAIGMLLTIIASVATMCVGSYPSHGGWARGWWEWMFNVIFTIELFVRIAAAQELKNLYLDAYMYFDFFAVVPFWAEKLGSVIGIKTEGAFFKILMALRMLRLLKISRQYDGSIVIVRALKVSLAALGVPFFFLMVAVIVFASVRLLPRGRGRPPRRRRGGRRARGASTRSRTRSGSCS